MGPPPIEMALRQAVIMTNEILSKADGNGSEISSLTSRVNRLSDAVDFWNAWMIGGLVLAALAAVLIVLATRLVVIRAKQLSVIQTELDAAKARKLQADLKDKDDQIALVQKDAADAQEKASDAKAAQQRVEIDLEKQKERAATAEQNLLELQQKLRERTITGDQILKFQMSVGGWETGKKRGEVAITTISDDPEAVQYANDLRRLLLAGGYRSPAITKTVILGDNAIGLSLLFSTVAPAVPDSKHPGLSLIPPDSPVAFGDGIRQGFVDAGIPLTRYGLVQGNSDKDEVVLIVGHKPPLMK